MASIETRPEMREGTPVPVQSLARRLLVPGALLLVYVAQCGWFIRTQSLTFDEPVHIFAGLDAWRQHRFVYSKDHPPLARLLMTLALRDPKWQVVMLEGTRKEAQVPVVQPDPIAMATRARAVNVVLGVLLGMFLWLAAYRIWSESAANFALGLYAFSPALIAHFSIATTDGIGALMIFVTALELVRWRRRPTWGETALMGLVLGLLLLAKIYTLPFFLLTLALMAVLRPDGWNWHPRTWKLGAPIAAAFIAIVVLWAGYFFHTAHLRTRNGFLIATYPHRGVVVKRMATPINFRLAVPALEYIDAVRAAKSHSRYGHPSFFLGRLSYGGWRSYYPVVMLLKWPVIVILLFAATLTLALRRKLPLSADVRLMAIYPIAMLVMLFKTKIQIGDRHLLPLYMFVLLICAGTWQFARLRQRRVLQGMLLAALALNAMDVLRYAPDYLTYFNVFVPPSQSWKLLSDSNLDWGQGLLAVRKYEQEHPNQRNHLAYFGSVSPDVYGVRAAHLPPDTLVEGTVIVSATCLSGQYLDDPQGYRWVLRYPLKAVLAHSLYVFEVPKGS